MQFIPLMGKLIFLAAITPIFMTLQKSFLYSMLICCSRNILIIINVENSRAA